MIQGTHCRLRGRLGQTSVWLALGGLLTCAAWAESPTDFAYPPTRRSPQEDVYHGVTVADPFRWLEAADEPAAAETQAWVRAQNALATSYLAALPQRARIRQRLEQLANYERMSIPTLRGDQAFYLTNAHSGTHPQLVVADASLRGPRVLLDISQLSADGSVALSGWRVSGDGRYLAYGLASAGSDWRQIRIREVATGRDLPERLDWVKYSDLAWDGEQRGFYYSRYDAPAPGQEHTAVSSRQKLYYHALGEPQAADRLIYERPDQPDWAFDSQVTEEGRFLVVRVWRGADRASQFLVRDLHDSDGSFVVLFPGFDAASRFVGSEGPTLWFLTDLEAPRGRIVAVDASHLDQLSPPIPWREVVPEADDVIQSASVVDQRLLVRYLHQAASRVVVYDLAGQRQYALQFAERGTVEGFTGRRADRQTFFAHSSCTSPVTIYRCTPATGECVAVHAPRLAFPSDAYETRQVIGTSRDGTPVPLTVVARKGLPLNGQHPTLLVGYGGFQIPLTPTFSLTHVVWLEMGGVLAFAHVRGGGEFGRDWHDAGRGVRKQNSIDDFVAAAEGLIEQGYTSPRRLAIAGRSNGGLLVGAALTQRPELFAAALPGVAVLDMLRYQKFTIGRAWIPEYGSVDDPAEFRALLAYSPLHQAQTPRSYPATLITTADHDDRVVPAHSYKFAAQLQATQQAPRPVLLRVESRGGHGPGQSSHRWLETAVDTLSFLAATLAME